MIQVIDRPIVLAKTDANTLGLYQTGHKLGIFMMLVVSMFQYAWQPFILNNAREKNAKEIFAKVMTMFVLAASLLWAVVSIFIDVAAGWEFAAGRSLIEKSFLPGLVVVPVILLAYLFNGIYVNLQAGLYIEEKTKYFPLITGAGALVNVAVNLLLIPRLGIMGAALAVLASYMVMAAGLFIFAQTLLPNRLRIRQIAQDPGHDFCRGHPLLLRLLSRHLDRNLQDTAAARFYRFAAGSARGRENGNNAPSQNPVAAEIAGAINLRQSLQMVFDQSVVTGRDLSLRIF